MALSNTAVPKYYGMFRDAVLRDEIKINKEIAMEMLRIDELIENRGVYYDDQRVTNLMSEVMHQLRKLKCQIKPSNRKQSILQTLNLNEQE